MSTYRYAGFWARTLAGAFAVALTAFTTEAFVIVPATWEAGTRELITQAASTLGDAPMPTIARIDGAVDAGREYDSKSHPAKCKTDGPDAAEKKP